MTRLKISYFFGMYRIMPAQRTMNGCLPCFYTSSSELHLFFLFSFSCRFVASPLVFPSSLYFICNSLLNIDHVKDSYTKYC